MASKFSLEASLSMIDRFTGPLKKAANAADSFSNQMSKQFGRVNTRLDEMQKRANTAANQFAPMAMAATGMVIAGQEMTQAGKSIFNVLGSIVDEGKAFEKTMSTVAAIAGVDKASEDFARLEQSAMDLGASTKYSATQVGEAFTFLSMAGVKVNDQIEMMPDMLSLATVGNIDLAQAADIATNTMSAMSSQGLTMNQVANVMAATMTKSNVNMAMLADTFKYAAPIADSVGVSLQELAAMTGILGDSGIQASQAGTALRAAMIRLAKPPKEAADALDRLGISTSDAMGNMKNVPQLLDEIRTNLQGKGNAEQLAAVSSIFGAEATSAFMKLINSTDSADKSIVSLTKDIIEFAEANKLAEMAASMADNVEGAGLAFDSAASAVKIGIFNSFKDVWKEILQVGSRVLLWVYEFIKNNQTLVKWITIVVAVVGGVLVVLGTLITIGGTLAGAFVAMSMAAAMFGVSLSAAIWPVTLIVVGIIALIAYVYLLIKYWDNLMNFFRGTPGIIQVVLMALMPMVAIPLAIAANWDTLKAMVLTALNAISDAISGVVQWFSELNGWVQFAATLFAPFIAIPLMIAAHWDYLFEKVTAVISYIGENASAVAKFLGMDKWSQGDVKASAKTGASAQSKASPQSSVMERVNREMLDINVSAPPGTSAERRGKKSPNISLNMGQNGNCS